MQDDGTTKYNDMWEHDYGQATPEQLLNHDLEQPSPRSQSFDVNEIPMDEYKMPAVTPLRCSLSQMVMSIW